MSYCALLDITISYRIVAASIHLATQIFLEQAGHFIAKQCSYILVQFKLANKL